MTPREPTRRELLGAGAVGAAGLLALPAAAAADTTTTSEPPISAAERIRRLIQLELLGVYCYRYVLGSSILGPTAHSRLTPFVGHEEAHIGALTARLKARGGTVPPGPDSIKTANRDLGHRGIGGRLGQLQGERDALYMLLTLEQVTIGAYFVALMQIKDPDLVSLVCQIMANEAQHDAMIGLSLPKATPQSAVPYGLVQGLQ